MPYSKIVGKVLGSIVEQKVSFPKIVVGRGESLVDVVYRQVVAEIQEKDRIAFKNMKKAFCKVNGVSLK
jgi:hypothetical protein